MDGNNVEHRIRQLELSRICLYRIVRINWLFINSIIEFTCIIYNTLLGKVLPIQAKSCSGIPRGTLGIPGSLEVNYLTLDLKNMPNEAYHYDVTIVPDRPKKFLRPAFEQCQREVFGGIQAAFDGNKSCYTIQRLPTPIERSVQVCLCYSINISNRLIQFLKIIKIPDSGNRMKEFRVEIKETGDCVVDLNSLRT